VDSGFNYYGYRFYDPGAGRWLNGDPLDDAEILEGPNLYRAFRNSGRETSKNLVEALLDAHCSVAAEKCPVK
jgi:uncharacterized protein RhaS with RHS repeats